MPSLWKKLYIICIFVILFKQGDSQNLRLKDGRDSSQGRLEVKHNGEWGTVCSKNFNQSAAAVACTQLGFPSVWDFPASISLSFPGGPTGGRIWLDNVQCSGNELSLFDCDHNDWGDISSSCSHEDDVGIKCHNSEQGAVALPEDISSQNDFVVGRILVLYNTEFGYIHSNGWDYDDVKVVCRQLGYYTGGNYSICSACDPTPCSNSHSHSTSWDVSIDCDGNEEYLLDCTNASSWMPYRDECTHPYIAASVSCAVPKQGGWSGWTPVGQCSSPCSDGIQKFTRTCSRPAPKFGGEDCVGNSTYVASCGSPSCGNDSNEKHQLWKIVALAAGPAAVVGFTAGLIVLLTILIRNRRRLKHLCYGGEQLPGGQHVQEERPLVHSGNGGPDGGDN